MFLRQPARAKALLLRAIELNPSLAEAHSVLGDTYCWNAEPEPALESLRTALRLSSTDFMVFAMLSNMATAHWLLGAPHEALDHAEEAIVRQPGFWYAHAVKIAALMDAGRSRRSRVRVRRPHRHEAWVCSRCHRLGPVRRSQLERQA
jgi:tetratricopeptide (TPR) repeat protein